MNFLSQAKVSMLTYAATTDNSVQLTVVAAGTRVCLRAYGMMEYPTTNTAYFTKANFRTTSQASGVKFSDLAPLNKNFGGYAQGSPMTMVRIPGEGILFDDGLYVELEEVTNRTTVMQTLLQVVYT